ncbi:MAG: MazG nucleotide pyrophosphohydrolase domain-containing protein [Candidatus Nanoarchaeia archaeon]|nr:MazG nucleotide pyrophosphohydrolase domain-containing protein [Candidatus Nanoarchaeia archaeon]
MDVRYLQEEFSRVFEEIPKKTNMTPQSKELLFIHLTEEVGELARQIVNEEHRKEKFDKVNLSEEFGDVFMILCVLASKYDLDLSKECEEKLVRIRKKFNLD